MNESPWMVAAIIALILFMASATALFLAIGWEIYRNGFS